MTADGVIEWFSRHPVDRLVGVALVLLALLLLWQAGAGALTAQCGHPTRKGGACQRPVRADSSGCGYHDGGWIRLWVGGATLAIIAGVLVALIAPIDLLIARS